MPSSRLRPLLADRLGIDPRGLAAFRVGLGLALLLDLALRAADAAAFYTDGGVLPRSLLFEVYPALGRVSLHALSGALWWQLLLFGLTAVAAVALVAGYRSRVAALVAFFLVLSLHARNPAALNAGHSLLRRLLLWACLLPVGARWGVDAARVGGTSDARGRILSVATAGVLVQVLAVYLVNAVLKFRGETWHSGTALRYVYGLDAFTTDLGALLAGRSALLTLGNYGWLCLLAASPLLVLATRRTRTLLAGALAAGHLFMLATLRLDVFPLVSLAGLALFLPPSVWDRVEARTAHLRTRVEESASRLPARTPPVALGALGRRAARTVAVALLAFVLVWNAASVGVVALPADVGERVDPEERRWNMFAPEPMRTTGWYVTTGVTRDGERVDAFAGHGSFERPEDLNAAYPSHRWYVYLTELRRPRGGVLHPRFARYLCERWDSTHASELASVNVTFVAERVRLDGPDATTRRQFGTYTCPR